MYWCIHITFFHIADFYYNISTAKIYFIKIQKNSAAEYD